MPRTPAYRTSTGAPAQRGFVPARWHLLAFAFLSLAAAVGIIAGESAGDVITTLLHGSFVLPVILPAAMLGVLLTVPLARAKVFDASPAPAMFRLMLGTASGLGAFSLAMLALGSARLLHHGIPVAVPVLAAGVSYLPTRDFFKKIEWRALRLPATRGEFLLLFAAVPLATMLIAATFPPGSLWHTEGWGYDVREYHLQLPREYLAANSTAPVRHNVYSFLPGNIEMLYLLEMHVAQIVESTESYLFAIYPAQFLHLLIMMLAAGIVVLAPLPLSATGRAIAGVAFLGVPWVVVTGSLAYNDGGMLLFGAVAMALAFAPPSRTAAIAIGVSLGLAVGCKSTAGLMFAIPVAILLLTQRRYRALGWVVAAAAIVFAPWSLRSVAATGNPVFPMATRIFGTGHWSADQARRWDLGHSAPPSFQGIAGRLNGLVRESVGDAYWSYLPSGPSAAKEGAGEPRDPRRPGPLWFAVILAVGLAIWRGPQAWGLLAVLGLQVICWTAFTHLQGRFLLPMIVPLAWILGIGAGVLRGPRIVIGSLVAIHAVLCGLILIPERGILLGSRRPLPIGQLSSLPVVTSERAAYLVRHPEKLSICLLGEATPLYYSGTIYYASVFDRQPLIEILRQQGPSAARQYLFEKRINYLGINMGEISRLARTYGFEHDPIRDETELKEYLAQLADERNRLVETLTPLPMLIGSPETHFFLVTPPPDAQQ